MAHPAPHPIAAGQESVWDYPRPPRIEAVDRRVTIDLGGQRILDTTDVVRVLETSHPPVYYVPVSAFVDGALVPARGSSFCEFKGYARYFDVVGGQTTAAGCRLELSDPFARLRVARRSGRGVRRKDGRMHGRRRRGRPAAGWVLRRLGDLRHRRSVQRRPGHTRLVVLSLPVAARRERHPDHLRRPRLSRLVRAG